MKLYVVVELGNIVQKGGGDPSPVGRGLIQLSLTGPKAVQSHSMLTFSKPEEDESFLDTPKNKPSSMSSNGNPTRNSA